MPDATLDAAAQATTDATAATSATNAAADAAVAASTAATSATGGTPPITAAPVVPEKYELALPTDSTLDPAIVDRTAAIARSLGLSNAAGQELLNAVAKEVTDTTSAASTKAVETAKAAWEQEQVTANAPGGTQWTKREGDWRAQSLADPAIGGSPEKLAQSTEKAQQALAKYGDAQVTEFLTTTGLGSHPAVIGIFAKIGRAMSEGSFVHGTPARPDKPKSPESVFYGEDGMGPKTPVSTA